MSRLSGSGSFVRSGGHGGQNLNKVATCVVLRHLPSGVTLFRRDRVFERIRERLGAGKGER